MPRGGRVRLSLDVSRELNGKLEGLAKKIDGTKSEVLRRSISLMEFVVDAQAKGHRLWLVKHDGKFLIEVFLT